MREVELKLISELMKNSRRSDSELAKSIGVSQPTVARLRGKIEKEGHIREYTVIPDFRELGYRIMAISLVKLQTGLDERGIEKARAIARERLSQSSSEIVMLERGLGMGCDGVFISFHESYSSYMKFKNILGEFDFLDRSGCQSFLIDLTDKIRYIPLTFTTLAKHMLTLEKKRIRTEANP